MAVPTSVSFVLSSVISVLLFSLMQIYKPNLAASKSGTLFGGFIGSWLFVFSLTAISNLENILFGRGFQSRIFPEVLLCLVLASASSGMVHRVCLTTCVIFSLAAIYFINRISQKFYSSAAAASAENVQVKKKKNK